MHCVQLLKNHQTCGTCVAQMVWTCNVFPKRLGHIQFAVLVKLSGRAQARVQPHHLYCECVHQLRCKGHFYRQICGAHAVERICSHAEERLGLLNTWKYWHRESLNITSQQNLWLGKDTSGETQVPSSLHHHEHEQKFTSYFCTHLFHRRVDHLLRC